MTSTATVPERTSSPYTSEAVQACASGCRCCSIAETERSRFPRQLDEIDYEDTELEITIHATYGTAARVKVRYRLVGPVDAPVVVVAGGISASRAACDPFGVADSTGSNQLRPWWPDVVGDQHAIDTRRFRVLCFDWLVPADFVPAEEGDFVSPRAITTADQADALAALLTALRIDRVAAYVGCSYGGMVGLAFAARHPRSVGKLVAISATHRSHPFTTALRVIQRRIVRLGQAHGLTEETLALSRQLAMTTFRTPEEFRRRFDNSVRETEDGLQFEVAEYLSAVGEKFTARFTADRFLALSESLDLHDVDPIEISAPTTLVAVRSDRLIRTGEVRELGSQLGGPHYVHEIDSIYGHDAFLKEGRKISKVLRQFLTHLSE